MVNRTHSMRLLKDTISEVAGRGGKVIDQRTAIGKALMRWRAEIVQDLGGSESLSAQQHTVLDIAMRTKLLLDSADAWLARQSSLIDKRHRQLYPIVQQRAALADSLVRQLTTLGLGRVARKVPDLDAFIAASETARDEPSETSENHGRGD